MTRKFFASTARQWRIDVPKVDVLANPEQTLQELESLTQPEPYVRRLNRVRIDRRWMDLIQEGLEVRVKFDDWVNKSLARYQVIIYSGDEKKFGPPCTHLVGIEGMLKHFSPWAEFAVDEEENMEGAQEDYGAQCYQLHDSETGVTFYSQEFEEWYNPPKGLVPVSENGETKTYILLLSLNEFGKSFMVVDDYLADPAAQEVIGFELE